MSPLRLGCTAALLSLLVPGVRGDILSIGLAVPLYNSLDCVEGWEYYYMARTAARYVEAQPWWQAATNSSQIRFETLANADSFAAWQDAEIFAKGTPPVCFANATAQTGACTLLRGAIVGPSTGEAATLVQLVTRQADMPQLTYSVSAASLTPSAYRPLPPAWWDAVSGSKWPFFRYGYADEMAIGALVAFVGRMRWQMLTVVHVRNAYGDSASITTQEVIERSQSGNSAIFLQNVLSFASGDVAGMDKVLDTISGDVSRVIMLYAYPDDAVTFFQRAHAKGMVGKGWTWLGIEWVREFTWTMAKQRSDAGNMTGPPVDASMAEQASDKRRLSTSVAVPADGGGAGTSVSHASVAGSWLFGSSKRKVYLTPEETVKAAMEGAVGVVPFRAPLDSPYSGLLATFLRENANGLDAYMLNVSGSFPKAPLPTWAQCPGMFLPPVTAPGVPTDFAAAYVFDAVHAVASAVVDAIAAAGARSNGRATGLASVQPSDIAAMLYNGTTRASPLTGLMPTFLRTGDRYGLPMTVVNVQKSKMVTVGQWMPAIQPATNASDASVLMPGTTLFDGSFSNMKTVVWSSGSTAPPPDRIQTTSHAEAAALAAALAGMVLSLLAGAILHHANVNVLPESGATVLIGAGCGILLRFLFGSAARDTAGFSDVTFMLVLLPIIIFESGYSLNKRSFFTEFFSIQAFAIVGTIISALVIGFIVYHAGQTGAVLALTFEESMSFASLLSATDPVATLAVFSGLHVHPTLNALVYGEAVMNDAVAIVLYRTFTGFIVSDVTATATIWATASFIMTLVLSTIIGFLTGVAATMAFRYVNVTGQQRNVRWERNFISKLNQLRRLVPKIKVLQRGSDVGPHPHEEEQAADQGGDALDSIDLVSGVSETAVLLLFSYFAFSIAEAMTLSGIVASLFCGISMNHYTRRVLTRDGKVTSSAVFRMLATLADTAIFFEIGMNVILNLGVGDYNAGFIAVGVAACLVSRAANVFVVSYVLNKYRKEPISWEFQMQMWHAGLRGAIAFATALSFPSQNKDTIVNATSSICLLSIFFLGGTTVPMLKWMRIPYNMKETREDQVAAASNSADFHGVKGLMLQFDEWFSPMVYGAGFLKEMERLNAQARARAQERVAKSLGLSTSAVASVASALPAPSAAVVLKPTQNALVAVKGTFDDDAPASVTVNPVEVVDDEVAPPIVTAPVPPSKPAFVTYAVPRADDAVSNGAAAAGTGLFAGAAATDHHALLAVPEVAHHELSPIAESPAIVAGSPVLEHGASHATPTHHSASLPRVPSVGMGGADSVWPGDVVPTPPAADGHTHVAVHTPTAATFSSTGRPATTATTPAAAPAPASPFDEW